MSDRGSDGGGRRPERARLSPEEQRRRWAQIVDAILADPGTADCADAGDGPAGEQTADGGSIWKEGTICER